MQLADESFLVYEIDATTSYERRKVKSSPNSHVSIERVAFSGSDIVLANFRYHNGG